MNEPITAGGVVALLISAAVMWFREVRKTRNNKNNGEMLNDIKKSVKALDGKVDKIDRSIVETKTEIKNMRGNCQETVKRFTKDISENRNHIFEIVKKGKIK